MDNVEFLSVRVDLPFALSRWRKAAGLVKVKMLPDHRELSFGEALGVAIKELRLLARAIFVLDKNNKVTYVEYVTEATNHPDYAKAVVAVKNAADQSSLFCSNLFILGCQAPIVDNCPLEVPDTYLFVEDKTPPINAETAFNKTT